MKQHDNIGAIENADGLTDDERIVIARLRNVYYRVQQRNTRLRAYYQDENPVEFLGLAVPNELARKIGCRTGWAAKAVDYLASRSIFDGFTSADETVQEQLTAISADNRMAAEYGKGVIPELTYGCGFWTVSKGAKGEPPVIINYQNARKGAVLINHRTKRVLAGMVIEDYRPVTKKGIAEEPSLIIVHTDTHVITLERGEKDSWHASKVPHKMGVPLMVAMTYRPTDEDLGKSRITHAVQDIIGEAQRQIVRTAFASEASAQPLRYMLNADESTFDMDKLSLAYNSFLLAGKDDDGDTAQIGQLQGNPPDGHIAVMEHLMSRMSGETGIPVSSFGLKNANYQSSDALRASSDDLILEAEALNRSNAEALVDVARMALAIMNDKTLAELTPEERNIAVHWIKPSMPSEAAQTDAMVKQASVVDWLPETEIYWEKMGYSEEERVRIEAARRRMQGRMTVDEVLALD